MLSGDLQQVWSYAVGRSAPAMYNSLRSAFNSTSVWLITWIVADWSQRKMPSSLAKSFVLYCVSGENASSLKNWVKCLRSRAAPADLRCSPARCPRLCHAFFSFCVSTGYMISLGVHLRCRRNIGRVMSGSTATGLCAESILLVTKTIMSEGAFVVNEGIRFSYLLLLLPLLGGSPLEPL